MRTRAVRLRLVITYFSKKPKVSFPKSNKHLKGKPKQMNLNSEENLTICFQFYPAILTRPPFLPTDELASVSLAKSFFIFTFSALFTALANFPFTFSVISLSLPIFGNQVDGRLKLIYILDSALLCSSGLGKYSYGTLGF